MRGDLGGTTLTLDATGTHHAEVHADVGFSGGTTGRGWIDLLANGDITLRDGTGNDGADARIPSPATDYLVHANMLGLGNSTGGDILVQSKSGRSRPSAGAPGQRQLGRWRPGGTVTVQAGGAGATGNVAFGTASVQAEGATSGGGGQAGGTIAARSFNGDITGTEASSTPAAVLLSVPSR